MLDAMLFGVWYQIMVLLLPKGSLSLLVDEEEEKELVFVCPWSVLYRYTGPCGEGEMYVWYHRGTSTM
jgi:hypothetical protein